MTGPVQAVVQSVDWLVLAPVLGSAIALVAVLIVQAVLPGRSRLLDAITLAGLVLSGLALVPQSGHPRSTFCSASGCSFSTDGPGLGLQVVVIVASLVTVLLSMGDLDRRAPEGTLARAEFWVLLLAATTGALVLVGARDLFTLVIGLETAALPVIGLVGAARTCEAAQAALRLLLVSVVSFGLTLLGAALLFAGSGTVYLDQFSRSPEPVTLLGLVLIVAGVGYKVAALPFGLWVPDVYPACPLPIAAYLSTASKVAGVAAVALLLSRALPGAGGVWFAVVVAVTMTLANLVALTQHAPIGVLAWSTIAQAGWALLPLAGLGPDAVLRGAVSTYLLAYAAASLAAFAVVLLVSRHHEQGRKHTLDDEAGLLRREPVAAGVLILALLSLAGLPPGLAGLVAKIAALRPVVAGEVWWLAVLAAVNVAIALAYYLRWVSILVMPALKPGPTWRLSPTEAVALSVAAGMLLTITALPGLIVI